MKHFEHPSKALGLVGMTPVVLPEADESDCTAWVRFGKGEDGEPEWEGLLAKRLAPDRARVCAVPVFVHDLNLGDEVSVVESAEGAPVATGLIRDAGNYTFRVFFENIDEEDDEHWWRWVRDLACEGCWFDVQSARLVAISAPPDHAQAVADYLQGREQAGDFLFDTGRTRHLGRA